MDLTDLLKGKKVNYMTDAKVMVELEIESVEGKHHSRDWTTINVKFTTGFVKSYRSLNEIDLAK